VTKDVIALTGRMPDAGTILAGLLAGGPGLPVDTAGEGALIRLCDERGRPLVSVEAPLLVSVPGEAARLLGADVPADGPLWWTEARAATGVRRAELLAAAFGRRVAAVLGGTVWPADAVAAPPETSGVTAAEVPAAAQPAVDVLTGRAAVVIQDRPVVALTAWLSDALRAAAASGRALQIVTPPGTRLTPPLRAALSGLPHRWVVRDGEAGYYDGLSGAVLRWHEGAFAPVEAPADHTPVAPAHIAVGPSDERQLALSFRVVHPADDQLLLGGAVEEAWQALTGGPPRGWSTAEPVGLPWSRRELTALARQRAPRSTWFVVVGAPERPAIATVKVSRTPEGVEEDVTLAVGYGAGESPPLDGLPDLAGSLVTGYRLSSALVQLRQGRRDLSAPATFEPPAVPVGFALGAAQVREIGLTFARRPPLPVPPVQLGTAANPGLYYPLGDGTAAEGWTAFEALMRHLRGAD
jgi:Family of unknown function (DUF6177)